MTWQAILVTTSVLLLTASTRIHSAATCPNTCGNITVPFPFGTNPGCNLDQSFHITCNYTYNPPKPFLNSGGYNVEVLHISIDGLIKVLSSVATDCYDASGARINGTVSRLGSSKFPISSTRNKFTAVGCDTYALVEGSDQEWKRMSAGCVSWCDNIENVADGTCSGIGCCQTSIPKGVKDFSVNVRSFRNHTIVTSFNPCGYAFVVEAQAFEFSSLDLKDLKNRKSVPVVLDWSVGNGTCLEALKDVSSYACRAIHSECTDSSNGVGYRCSCLKGFEGNPYLVDGCQDIDECATLAPCEGTCTNLPGSYSCSGPKGFEGDNNKEGDGFHSKSKIIGSTMFYMASVLVAPVLGSSFIIWLHKQKKVVAQRKSQFRRNGGDRLEKMLSSHKTLVIFTAEDLKNSTNNYDENRVLHGGQPSGITYTGILPGGTNRTVTIQECPELKESDMKVFVSKLVTFSRISHMNVVKLIGCCLEKRVPLLVYEFISVETLYDYIPKCHLSWDIRMTIATETAQALDYMHSHGMVHGYLSSSCILLTPNDYTVKVHGFALTSDVRFYTDMLGYLDPEYIFSGQSTKKSDVYSFGVILAELLTGRKAIDPERKKREKLLAECFVFRLRQNNLLRILDLRMNTEAKIEQITQVAKLAQSCLSKSSAERPTMKEVATALLRMAPRVVQTSLPLPLPAPAEASMMNRVFGVLFRRNRRRIRRILHNG